MDSNNEKLIKSWRKTGIAWGEASDNALTDSYKITCAKIATAYIACANDLELGLLEDTSHRLPSQLTAAQIRERELTTKYDGPNLTVTVTPVEIIPDQKGPPQRPIPQNLDPTPRICPRCKRHPSAPDDDQGLCPQCRW